MPEHDGLEPDRSAPPRAVPERRASWVSDGLEHLLADVQHDREKPPEQRRPFDADVLIVGSGYGGAMAAYRLAAATFANSGEPTQVVLLERGREYLPGAFPQRAAELPGHLRWTRPGGHKANGRLEGLFDVRVGADMSVLVGNGLGGGSLINAGVMLFPNREVFATGWPMGFPAYNALRQKAAGVAKLLGAATPQVAPVHGLPRLARMGELGAQPVPITVALEDDTAVGGVALKRCVGCGDCATGCNHGAKVSLDVSLLRQAQRRGVEIFTGATVSRLRRWRRAEGHEEGWELEVFHTDASLRARMERGVWLRARQVILAAGALGSTEILMRSQTAELQFSPRLGQGFSGNGDVLAAVFDAKGAPTHAVADEDSAPAQRHIGPTITSMVDLRHKDDFVLQDLAVPASLRRLFEEVGTTASMLQGLDHGDYSDHLAHNHQGAARPDPAAVDQDKIARSLVLALIGRDNAGGRISPVPDDAELPLDAGVRIAWPQARDAGFIEHVQRVTQQLLVDKGWADSKASAVAQGRLLPNPMWQLLPEGAQGLLGTSRGPMLTVHPLGGCAMGDDVLSGVVNMLGQVFDAHPRSAAKALHPGLVVLDGAIVPKALGINPALTIATVANLAVTGLASAWGLRLNEVDKDDVVEPEKRPVFAEVNPNQAPQPGARRTTVQVVERLQGWVDLPKAGRHWLQVDLAYKPMPLFPPTPGGHGRPAFKLSGHVLPVQPDSVASVIRVFEHEPGALDTQPADPDAGALLVVPIIDGSYLRFFHRQPTTARDRRCRALQAWLWNRGWRDIWQAVADRLQQKGQQPGLKFFERVQQALALATRAGEGRLFSYELHLGQPKPSPHSKSLWPNASGPMLLRGHKLLSYTRRGNPWTQLMEMEIDSIGGVEPGPSRTLRVSPAFFAARGMPLLRVVEQQDQPTALIDLLCFVAYGARVLLGLHLWSMRKPDTPKYPLAPAARLANRLPDLPCDPEEFRFRPDGAQDDGEIRLLRYPKPQRAQPVLMIHGYSASSTTFAHPLLQPSLASHLWRCGFEPWVVDLRTSSGLGTADRPYTFEDIALADIPAAIDRVCAVTSYDRVDVVSHCMGSAMLTMALQARQPSGPLVAARLRRWVMSQFGPRLRFSAENLLRAYLISYFVHALPGYRYSLRPGAESVGVDGDLYDRFIATLPYLNDASGHEFDIENPIRPCLRTPWVGTRHRLDALIGRTFDARQMDAKVLDRIDDFFGPVNLRTLSQPIYFARMGEVSDHLGMDSFGTDAAPLLRRVPMLSLHGATNGLADPQTKDLLVDWATRNSLQLESELYDGRSPEHPLHGHQDLLIGRNCLPVFKRIVRFLT